MGTRSTTKVISEWDETKILVSMYRQFDGYISGHGHELANFLLERKIVNGLGRDTADISNGMGELAAHIVTHFKNNNSSGNIYLTSPDDEGEYYNYIVYITQKPDLLDNRVEHPRIKVICGDEEVFNGTPQELLDFVEDEDD